jgi:DNA-binding GntR family transcriptional regulator
MRPSPSTLPDAPPAAPRRPQYEVIADAVALRIADGLIPGAALLKPAALAEAFSTSRVPATMALDRLAEAGAVVKLGARGYRVPGDGEERILESAALAVSEEERSALRVRNWRDRIYDEIETAVAGCLLFGRYQITSQALAEHYGVSRTVAQECISRLERIGIVKQEANGRWSAGMLDRDRKRDLFELRRILEPVALRQSPVSRDRERLLRMRRRVRDAIATQHTAEPIQLRSLEEDLHCRVVLECPNGEMRETLRRCQQPLFSTYLTAIDFADMPDVARMLAAHLAVFDALVDGDIDAAAARLDFHLTEALIDLPERLARFDTRAARIPAYLTPAD